MDAWASPWADDPDESSHRRTVSTLGQPLAEDTEFLSVSNGPRNIFITDSLPVSAPSLSFTEQSQLPTPEIWARVDNPFPSVSSSEAWANDIPSTVFQDSQPSEHFSGWGVERSTSANEVDVLGIGALGEAKSPRWGSQDTASTPVPTVTKPTDADHWHQYPGWDSVEAVPVAQADAVPSETNEEQNDGLDSGNQGEEDAAQVQEKEISVTDVGPTDQSKENEHPMQETSRLGTKAEQVDCITSSSDQKEQEVDNADLEDDDFGDFGDAGEFEEQGMSGSGGIELPFEAPTTISVTKLSATPLDFNIDTSLLAKLYPIVAKPLPLPPVDDIISTIDARKAWYQITRDGTLGKHKSGNSDDYVRVIWAKSKIREDVNNIVIRWIKEGRFFAGGAVTGARSFGAMFGWGEGASTTARDQPSKTVRHSVPIGLGLKDLPNSTHKASISISGWDPLAANKSGDASPAFNFAWASPVPGNETITDRDTVIATSEEGVRAPTSPHEAQLQMSYKRASGNISSGQNTLPQDEGPSKIISSNTNLYTSKSSMTIIDNKNSLSMPSAPNNASTADNWAALEGTTAKNISREYDHGSGAVTAPKIVTSVDQWSSLDLLEAKAAAPKTSQMAFEMDFAQFETDLRNETPKASTTFQLPTTIHNDDNDWGEMITTSVTINPKERRPSTAHGDVRPFGSFKEVGWENTNNGFTRRDSAPSLAVPISSQGEHEARLSSVVGLGQPIPRSEQRIETSGGSDWDFSVFERIKAPSVPATLLPMESGSTRTLGERSTSKEDMVVSGIVSGLPDLSYMLM